jgi:hypothetical protein
LSTKSAGKLPFTSVVSYHTDTYGCGVARFSKLLADRLGVPMVPLSPDPALWGDYPLLSLKRSELSPDHVTYARHQCCPDGRSSSAEVMRTAHEKTYGVFWHDAGDAYITAHAQQVFYADPSLGSPGLWCPSLLPPRAHVRLFSLGMAHKIQSRQYTRVRELLDNAGLTYHLRVSVGLHEGTSLSDATKHFDALKDIMGADKVTILGCLSDEAVVEEFTNADYVLAFFIDGLRSNNTTVQAALQHGKRVISNLDPDSPDHGDVYDINTHTAWPDHGNIGQSWDALIHAMEAHVCAVST